MYTKFIRHCVILLSFLILLPVLVRAQFEEGKSSGTLVPLVGTAITPGATNTVTYANSGEVKKIIKNTITFKINEGAALFFKSSFSAIVYLKIDTWAKAAPLSASAQTRYTSLVVNYNINTGATYNVLSYVLLDTAEQVKITVDTITVSGNTGWDPTPALQLENQMSVLRYYVLSNNPSLLIPKTLSAINTADASVVTWSWNAGTNNNLSQLEWVWVPMELPAGYYANNELLFQNNSTRVDLDPGVNTYSIPLMYDSGMLYYRVRAALRKNDGSVITGPWSGVSSLNFLGHQTNLNWQSSTSFAENGKLKTVIQYFDGSMRGRQTVTKDNSTGNTIVAETIYDLQGRPNVQILPTPNIDNTIQYFKNFNRFTGQQQQNINGQQVYDDPAKYFDLSIDASKCAGAPALDTTTGTGKYYSSLNPWLNADNEKSKYIPNAQGFAFTETRYTDDATQRVSRQGGVGPAFQINNGHDTRYYYGKPAQPELDALFGTEVGDASHYRKNMVMDANGQMSVSYTDMHGRTIATGLAGETPGNVQAIYNSPLDYAPTTGVTLINQLLTPATNLVSGTTIQSVSSLLVPAATNYAFTYQLDPATLNQLNCNKQQICFDCKYNLEISIRAEDCNNLVPIIKNYNNLQITPCGGSMGFIGDSITVATKQISFNLLLTPGSWVVRKTLTLNDAMYALRKDSSLAATLCSTEQNIYDSIYKILVTGSGCNAPGYSSTKACDYCMASLGNFISYRTKYLSAIGVSTDSTNYNADIQTQFTADSLSCAGACGATSTNLSGLKALRNQLLNDMVPFTGQYAVLPDSIKNAAGVFDPKRLETKYNIFTTSYTTVNGVAVPKANPYYQYPLTESGQPDYFTEDKHIDISIEPSGKTNDRSLLGNINPVDYTNLFQRSWATSLITRHPEYSKLQFAEANLANAFAWVDGVQACTTYSAALSNGYLTPLSSDPYLVNNNSADKTVMSQYLTNSLGNSVDNKPSIWQMANASVSCAAAVASLKADCIAHAKKEGMDMSLNSDQVWQQFKTIYLSYRNELVLTYINKQQNVLSRADMDSLLSQGKQLVFANTQDQATQNKLTWWAKATATATTVDTASVAKAAVTGYSNMINPDKCNGQLPFWKAKLLQCEQLQSWLNKKPADTATVNTVINAILNGMLVVCQNTSTPQQPFGNSAVSAANSASPKSFEAIINQVFKQNGIASIADSNYFCNPFTIDFPKPLGKNPPLFTNNSNRIDSCNCQRFAQLKTAAKTAGFDTLNLAGTMGMNQFLLLNYKDSLTPMIWQGLQKCGANTTQDCTYTIGGAGYQTGSAYPASGCSANPVITGVNYLNTSNTYNIQLNYTSSTSSTNCKVAITNIATSVTSFQAITCGSSTVTLSLPACQAYSFQIWTGCPQCRTAGTTINCTDGTSNTFQLPACNTVCKKTVTPIVLASVEVLPPFLSCDYQKPCISCATLNDYVAEFKTIYLAYTVPYTDSVNVTTKQLQQNALLARFLNYRTGFTKTASEYLAVIAGCAGNNGTAAVLCSFKKPLNDGSDVFTKDTVPCRSVQVQALFMAQVLFQQRKTTLAANFDSLYSSTCLTAKNTEQFFATYQPKEYHYTLYYYDQAGNLVKTLPPAAVKPNYGTDYLAKVIAARKAATDKNNPTNNEVQATQYRYNSLNQVQAQKTPDASTSKFWYDRLGRLAISQNAKQQDAGQYSYTLYDLLGRITEVGQKPQTTQMTQQLSQDSTALQNWLTGPGTKQQITVTRYDTAYPPLQVTLASKDAVNSGLWQKNLRNRVSYTYVKQTDSNDAGYPWDAASFYTYDIHGNVDTLLQDYKTGMGNINCSANNPSGNRFKKMVYSYDLISGKVNDVAYQPGSTDQYFHHYEYDAANRLILVKTSKDKTIWEREAVYEYYRHGPLARVELGQNRVQGLDYAYTLQGWLKGVNSSAVNTATTATNFDIGRDGVNSNDNGNNIVARDAFGFSLNYFSGDYQTVNASVLPFTPVPAILPAQPSSGMVTGSALFNGNIAAMVVNIPQLGAANTYGYRYDQLNRIVRMDAFTGLSNATNSYGTAPVRVEDYHEEITYDPNGNISTYLRNGDSRNRNMDNLAYKYNSNNNQLNQVIDAVTDATPADYHDIKTQPNNNYGYDSIGNLVSDSIEGIKIDWTVYGKIRCITKKNGTIIKYSYDASGNRISKIVITSGTGDSTYYVRDASGNTMSVYNKKGTTDLLQTELHLYGSSRLGIHKVNNNVQNCTVSSSAITSFTRGNKFFELSNHLGNVLATISDKKISVSTNNTSIDYYKADVMTATDYYPFGMQLPGRNGHAVIIGNINPDGTTNNITNDLTVNSRSGNNPSIYSAINSITFMDGFATETSDGFETVLGNNPPTGGGSNSANWSSGSSNYRYGFNGKENDNEVKGDGNQQDYGMRIYDPRLGRFLSEDPIIPEYPELTPYQFASNSPIANIDLDGLEKLIYVFNFNVDKITKTQIELAKAGPLGDGILVKSNYKGNVKFYYGKSVPNGNITSFKKSYEGVNLDKEGNHVGYKDSKGHPTIGIGHLIKKGEAYKIGSKMTDPEAQTLFKVDQKIITTAVDKKLSSFTLTVNQTNALYDASFNLGPGKLSQYQEDGTKYSGENFFFKFMGDGEGIRKRRFAESLLYSVGTYNALDVLKGKKNIAAADKVVSENEPKSAAKKEDNK